MLLALALQVAAPLLRPVNDPAAWFTADDYPAEALKAHEAGAVGYEAEVGPAGLVTACRVARSSGSPSLDAVTCALVFARARFPAGAPGTYKARVAWTFPTRPMPAAPIELRRAIREARAGSTLHVDAGGIITRCDELPRAYVNFTIPPDLCHLFPAGSRYSPPTVQDGRPVRRKITISMDVSDVNVR
jgi:TonB family protein